MKLIIDIDEEDYKGICHLKNEQLRMLPVEVAETLIRIANGTPLNKIRAEIAEYKDDQIIHAERNEIIDIVLGIIDKYREGERE